MLVCLAGRLFAVPTICTLCILLFPPLARAALPSGPLLIGEVAWAGSSKSAADEWIELWNLGDQPIDLTGYSLSGAGGTNGIPLDGQTVPPQSAILVANYDAEKSALAIDPALVTSAISLPNDKLQIELFDSEGALVDVAGDRSTPPAGTSSSSTKAAMLRAPDGAWRTSDGRQRMDEGVADMGTPGICDGCAWSDADLTPVETTSTEPIPEPSPSSTETLIEQAASSTSPQMESISSTEPVIETATTTMETVPESVIVPTAEPTSPSPTVITRTIPYPAFRLHQVYPAPSNGEKEWVEIRLPSGTTLASLDGYALYDATGRAALFPPSDMTLISVVGDLVRIHLPSAKLNNGGDTVELRRPGGSVVERMGYPKTASGESWAKNPEGTAWVRQGGESEAPEERVVYAPPPEAIEFPIMPSQEDVPAEEARVVSETGPDGSAARPTVERNMPAGGEDDGTRAAQPVARNISPKTTTTKKNIVYEVTHDMLTKIEPSVRVAISGTVATKPGIVNKHHYVLLSPDGHGLYVRGSSKQPTPPLGSVVRVVGTLTLNDDGLSLGVGSKDEWRTVSTPVADPKTRVVNFLEPDLEDGWSLVEVQGIVREVKSTSVLLDLGDALVTVTMRSASGYRASRLNEGDSVRVRGLVDPRGEEPAIVTRSPQDVEILSHASLAPATDPPKGLPLWMPFGAAGITVAASEGYKRLKRLREQSRTAALIAKAHATD